MMMIIGQKLLDPPTNPFVLLMLFSPRFIEIDSVKCWAIARYLPGTFQLGKVDSASYGIEYLFF